MACACNWIEFLKIIAPPVQVELAGYTVGGGLMDRNDSAAIGVCPWDGL